MSDTAKLGNKKPHALDEARGRQIDKSDYICINSSKLMTTDGDGCVPENENV